MEDVVAVRIELVDGTSRFMLTWGRILDSVDPQPLEALVLRHCHKFALGAEPRSTILCRSLQDAAHSGEAPYFYEHLLWFGWHPIPFGPDYQAWRAEREAEMEAGRELLYCGRP